MRTKLRSKGGASDGETVVLSRRELARELRRKAYRDAKARRATDPRFLAMKEAAKVRRREMYQAAKEKKKAAVVAAKASEHEGKRARRAVERPTPGSERPIGSAGAGARAALARALEVVDLIEAVKIAGEREGAANDRS